MTTTFVTAFLDIYDIPYQNKDLDWRFSHFKKLCETGIPIAVFCSRDIETYFRSEILSNYKNVILIDAINLSETFVFETYKKVSNEITIELPNNRSIEKDSIEYLLLMNSKTEFIKRTIDINPFKSTHFAWIDFNIFHIFKDRELYTSHLLQNISKRVMDERFLTLPGCWSKEYVFDEGLINSISWRFCGGFFIGSAGRILELHSEYEKHFEDFLREKKKLIWEVNFWAYLELHFGLSVIWYYGDHNESILNFNIANTSLVLSNVPSFQSNKYIYDDWGDYIPTSTAYVNHKGVDIINTRLVNYWLYPNGGYLIKDKDSRIITRNTGSILIDGTPDGFKEMNVKQNDTDNISFNCNGGSILGLEDIRLYTTIEQDIGFIATSVNYSNTGRNRIVKGIYDINNGSLINNYMLVPPDPYSWCEKNWIPLIQNGIEHFIYKWFPFEIGTLHRNDNGEQQLFIDKSWTHSTPMFSCVRGSTTFIETEDGYLGVVHLSYEGSPRTYFHILVLLDKKTMMPLKYSDYFVFRNKSIEFCIGFSIKSQRYSFWISNFDRDPEVISINIDDIPLIFDFIIN